MSDADRDKIESALRRNRGRLIVSEWSCRLSAACGTAIPSSSFLSIAKTEELKGAFFARVKNETELAKLYWPKQDRDVVISYLQDRCVDVRTTPVVLFSRVDRFIGAVRLPADCVLRHAMSVWAMVEEDLSLASEDLQHGLCLEQNFNTPCGEYVSEGVYELTAWGVFRSEK